jgi:hypothetical protein
MCAPALATTAPRHCVDEGRLVRSGQGGRPASSGTSAGGREKGLLSGPGDDGRARQAI